MSEPLSPSAILELSTLSGIPIDDTAMAERIAAGAAAAVEAVRSVAAAQAAVAQDAAMHEGVEFDEWLFDNEPSGYLSLLEQLAEGPR
ncbi:MAG: hypothetical protein FGM43_07655 [Sinobacteraceae bacterium]|nr:hypothetical protein [Nevskiaceae bacterium]